MKKGQARVQRVKYTFRIRADVLKRLQLIVKLGGPSAEQNINRILASRVLRFDKRLSAPVTEEAPERLVAVSE